MQSAAMFVAVVALLALFSQVTAHAASKPHTHTHSQVKVGGGDASVAFLAVGDWGGMPIPPYTTPGQRDSAKGMDLVAGQLQADFFLALGDNFYFSGVEESTSNRFNGTFQNTYTGTNLMKPWYLIAGNHDHKGNVQAQIDYTELDGTGRWNYPALYHSHSFTDATSAVTVDVILLDTVDLCSMSDVMHENEPGYFDTLPLRTKGQAAEDGAQWAWLEQQLSGSTADHILVGGHFPVYSVCEHGNTPTLIEHLKPLLEQYNAHYMHGHDHCMSHMKETGSTVNYILTGMGDTCCYEASNKENIPADSLKFYLAKDNNGSLIDGSKITAGFTSFVASKSDLIVKYYDQHGTLLFAADAIPSRSH